MNNFDQLKGTYKHYKGNLYEVIGQVVHSETYEQMILYRTLTGSAEYPAGTYWVRPKEMFLGTVENNGVIVKRFEKINEL
jgi:hypothetical protein